MPCHLADPRCAVVRNGKPAVLPPRLSLDTPVDLLDGLDVLHEQITEGLCEAVYQSQRTTERQRELSLRLLAEFWTAVVVHAPNSLTQAIQEACQGSPLYPGLSITPEAFFMRSRDLDRKFFHALYYRLTQNVLPLAEPLYAEPAWMLGTRYASITLIDGSRCDAVARRLKIARQTRSVILPGSLIACYDLCRGITRQVLFDPDAAKSELARAKQVLPAVPRGSLVVGDRLYSGIQFFWALEGAGLKGVFRLHGNLSFRRQHLIERRRLPGGVVLEDWLVEAGSGQTGPKIMLRWFRLRGRGERKDLVTSELDPTKLSAEEGMALYPLRWKVERLFNDLKTVLNLHRFYAANPNAVAMQVYATAMVHTAFRIAQSRIAKSLDISPDLLSTAKLFPRLATASAAWTTAELVFGDTRRVNATVDLKKPDWHQMGFARTTLGTILVEPRNGHRKRPRFCASRKRWTSFAHIPGGKKLISGRRN